jgi:hypothetical protein
MSDHTFDHNIQELAAKRGRSVVGVIGEALRLEVLFSESLSDSSKAIYVRERGEIRQLLGFG